ncbi:tRNA (adenosine(37)-N6)-threonylcarbamoyltransferase complex transferase subunit TsaD [Candidatus Kaiserbacteria bacterium]|nr:tRNA (adenosine(37)-N6)-threonylcarbamoyltransferase complex transferase subunit TsaD [Candidatus Kaiserbacteria bacterium]
MRILAIETSCDETAVALVEGDGGMHDASFSILGDALYSQAALHAPYGGVYPSLAKREHQVNLAPLATEALREAGLFSEGKLKIDDAVFVGIRDDEFKNSTRKFLEETTKPEIDLIAVTHGPGLEPALWTGINFAQALARAWDIPLLGIDHMEGHVVSGLLVSSGEKQYKMHGVMFPLLTLLISGGHTELNLMNEWFSYEHVGKTKDDAVGEAFDKVARLLDLSYPGGPQIQEAAARSRARGGTDIEFPRPLMHDDTCDFSFSGLKTAVLYKLRAMEEISETDKEEIAQAFEWRAIKQTKPRGLVVGGGVSANTEIRKSLQEMLLKEAPEVTLFLPEAELTGDNAIMIGAAAYLRALSGKKSEGELSALGNLTLSESNV